MNAFSGRMTPWLGAVGFMVVFTGWTADVSGENKVTDTTRGSKSDGDPWRGQAIFHAIEARDLGRVTRLVEEGADIEASGFGKMTPVNVAASAGIWDIVLFLLERGADPSKRDHQGVSAVDRFRRGRRALSAEEDAAYPKVEAWLREHGFLEGS